MHTITAAEKGRIVISAEICKKMKKRGTKMHVDLQGGAIIFRPETTEYVDSLIGIFFGGQSLTKILLKERAVKNVSQRKSVNVPLLRRLRYTKFRF
jgi:hypothetical protein